jgi:hypothetical protein
LKIRRPVRRKDAERVEYARECLEPGLVALEFGAPLPELVRVRAQRPGRARVAESRGDITVPGHVAERLRAVAESRGITEMDAVCAAITIGRSLRG